MDINADQLRSRYESLQTEELLALLAEGGLTEEAGHLLNVELRNRGAVDRNGALVAGAATDAGSFSEPDQRMRSHPAARFALVGASVLTTVGLACVSNLAPSIWHSPADRVCQAHGYWHATEVGLTKVQCVRWVRARH